MSYYYYYYYYYNYDKMDALVNDKQTYRKYLNETRRQHFNAKLKANYFTSRKLTPLTYNATTD